MDFEIENDLKEPLLSFNKDELTDQKVVEKEIEIELNDTATNVIETEEQQKLVTKDTRQIRAQTLNLGALIAQDAKKCQHTQQSNTKAYKQFQQKQQELIGVLQVTLTIQCLILKNKNITDFEKLYSTSKKLLLNQYNFHHSNSESQSLNANEVKSLKQCQKQNDCTIILWLKKHKHLLKDYFNNKQFSQKNMKSLGQISSMEWKNLFKLFSEDRLRSQIFQALQLPYICQVLFKELPSTITKQKNAVDDTTFSDGKQVYDIFFAQGVANATGLKPYAIAQSAYFFLKGMVLGPILTIQHYTCPSLTSKWVMAGVNNKGKFHLLELLLLAIWFTGSFVLYLNWSDYLTISAFPLTTRILNYLILVIQLGQFSYIFNIVKLMGTTGSNLSNPVTNTGNFDETSFQFKTISGKVISGQRVVKLFHIDDPQSLWFIVIYNVIRMLSFIGLYIYLKQVNAFGSDALTITLLVGGYFIEFAASVFIQWFNNLSLYMHKRLNQFYTELIAAQNFVSPSSDFVTNCLLGKIISEPFDMSDRQTILSTVLLRKKLLSEYFQTLYFHAQTVITISLFINCLGLYFILENMVTVNKSCMINYAFINNQQISPGELYLFLVFFIVFQFLPCLYYFYSIFLEAERINNLTDNQSSLYHDEQELYYRLRSNYESYFNNNQQNINALVWMQNLTKNSSSQNTKKNSVVKKNNLLLPVPSDNIKINWLISKFKNQFKTTDLIVAELDSILEAYNYAQSDLTNNSSPFLLLGFFAISRSTIVFSIIFLSSPIQSLYFDRIWYFLTGQHSQ